MKAALTSLRGGLIGLGALTLGLLLISGVGVVAARRLGAPAPVAQPIAVAGTTLRSTDAATPVAQTATRPTPATRAQPVTPIGTPTSDPQAQALAAQQATLDAQATALAQTASALAEHVVVTALDPPTVAHATLPVTLTLTGAHLDRVATAQLIAADRAPIDLAMVTTAPGVLRLRLDQAEALTYTLRLNDQLLATTLRVVAAPVAAPPPTPSAAAPTTAPTLGAFAAPPAPVRPHFRGALFDQATDDAAQCGAQFDSTIWGSVQDARGRGLTGAVVQVASADGRHTLTATTDAGGQFRVGGLGCTTWMVTLVAAPGASDLTADSVTVTTVNGGHLSAAGVRFRRSG
jgi:hypothetical protein